MLKSLKESLLKLLDFFLPERKDFWAVKQLNENSLNKLPKAPEIEGMDWVHSLFHYRDDRVRAIIWELKYKENTLQLEHIGRLLYDEIISAISEVSLFDNDASFVLIPIPITPNRRSDRGYNQSEHIAKSILENDTEHILLYAPQWFEKIKETPKQSHSHSKIDRANNLRDCFKADERLSEKYVILIDDVVTTGSTFLEAKKTLDAIGVKDVFAFTIAH